MGRIKPPNSNFGLTVETGTTKYVPRGYEKVVTHIMRLSKESEAGSQVLQKWLQRAGKGDLILLFLEGVGLGPAFPCRSAGLLTWFIPLLAPVCPDVSEKRKREERKVRPESCQQTSKMKSNANLH